LAFGTIDLLVLGAALARAVPLDLMLYLHVVVAAVVFLALHSIPDRNHEALAGFCWTATLIGGPFAAICSTVIILAVGRTPTITQATQWGWLLSGTTEQRQSDRLFGRLQDGRVADPTAQVPVHLMEVLESGPLRQKQEVLGIIALNYNPEYLPLLVAALKNPSPPIRTQAAAVITKLRADTKLRLDQALNRAGRENSTEASCLEIISTLVSVLSSGLLDKSQYDAAYEKTLLEIDGLSESLKERDPSSKALFTLKSLVQQHLFEQAATAVAEISQFSAHMLRFSKDET
jgi:hypothetical protein